MSELDVKQVVINGILCIIGAAVMDLLLRFFDNTLPILIAAVAERL